MDFTLLKTLIKDIAGFIKSLVAEFKAFMAGFDKDVDFDTTPYEGE